MAALFTGEVRVQSGLTQLDALLHVSFHLSYVMSPNTHGRPLCESKQWKVLIIYRAMWRMDYLLR